MRGGEGQAGASLLAELEALEPDLLRKRWRSLLRTPAPRGLTRPLLIRILAWREQVLATGDLDKAALSVLESAMGAGNPEIVRTSSGRGKLRPGMVLVREHGGVLHRVAVLADGFAWNGNLFGSLSAVARAITGVNWNGPKFFGLKTSASASATLRKGQGAAEADKPQSLDGSRSPVTGDAV